MKRILRVLIFGSIFAISELAIILVLPIVFLLYWLADENLGEVWGICRELHREAWRGLWYRPKKGSHP